MSKKILMSIKPHWAEKIFTNIKIIEVRKTAPKIDTPFEVLVYKTKHKGGKAIVNEVLNSVYGGGKVIGSFICDKITRYESEFWDDDTYERIQEPWEPSDFAEYGEYEYDTIGENGEFYGKGIELSKQSCLSWSEFRSYVGQGLKDFYGWHITEPKLFDKPRELCEFYAPCRKGKETADESCKGCSYAFKGVSTGEIICDNAITRPPQSFCYIEVDE